MRVIPIVVAGQYEADAGAVAFCLKVTRTDDEVFGFTEHDRALTIDGVDYEPGFSVSQLVQSEGLAVDNLELTVVRVDETMTAADLLAGKWDNAAFEIFAVNWKDTSDVDVLKAGTTGEVTLRNGQFVVEFRSLKQALQQAQGIVTSKTCRARLGDSKCTKDLASFTYSGALTAVTSASVFTDSGRGEAGAWFAEGEIEFTSGDNEGLRRKVKVFLSGQFTTSLPFPYVPQVGDTYTAIAGCRKRLEDCRDKFDNVLNMQAEPHLPGQDKLTKSPTSASQEQSTVPALPAIPSESGDGGS